MTAPDLGALPAELESHPEREALTSLVRRVALEAAGERRAGFLRETTAVPADLPAERAGTSAGNLVQILERGANSSAESGLVSALLALAVAPDFPSAPETELGRASELVFLAAHTPCNALVAADALLGEERLRPLWRAVAAQAEPAAAAAARQPDSFAALALLAASESGAARAAARELAERTRDPVTRAVLGARVAPGDAPRLSGELAPAPHGPVATTLLALSGLLLLTRGARLLGRLGLAFRQPAELTLGPRGLEIAHRTELLGRVIRARETLVPLANLARITREVRYPRLGLYLGLVALAIGSYLGVGLLVDGVRVPGGSPPLLGMGLVVVLVGLGIDYGLTTLSDNVRGRCRVVIEPRKGRRLCVGALDPERVDAMLKALSTTATAKG